MRTTGSTVVDRVRTALSYNDIYASQNPDRWGNQNATGFQLFNDKVYQLITSEVLDIYQDKCTVFNDRCINAKRKAGERQRSKKIDATFFRQGTDCLILGAVTGNMDCKFWLRDGLHADIRSAKELDNQALRSAVRRQMAKWSVYASEMPDESVPHTRSYAQVRACVCVWVVFTSSYSSV